MKISAQERDLSTNSLSTTPRTVLVSGASGLVGSALCERLGAQGHQVRSLGRSKSSDAQWNPTQGQIDTETLGLPDQVVHLAGENIASGRWNATRMAAIKDSRVQGTRLLCETLAGLRRRPDTLVCASAIGFYGDRPGEELDEESALGQGFLPEVCSEWEQATAPARDAGIRVVQLRIGVVLAKNGGALAKMLLPFKMGVGGNLGNGRQDMSWIGLTDLVRSIEHCLNDDSLNGPVNAVAPAPATNADFTAALGRVLRRPTIFPVPAPMARLALGRMADELLLASTRVRPRRLFESGFRFEHPDLDSALRHELGVGS